MITPKSILGFLFQCSQSFKGIEVKSWVVKSGSLLMSIATKLRGLDDLPCSQKYVVIALEISQSSYHPTSSSKHSEASVISAVLRVMGRRPIAL